MSYMRSSHLTQLISESLYPFTNFSQFLLSLSPYSLFLGLWCLFLFSKSTHMYINETDFSQHIDFVSQKFTKFPYFSFLLPTSFSSSSCSSFFCSFIEIYLRDGKLHILNLFKWVHVDRWIQLGTIATVKLLNIEGGTGHAASKHTTFADRLFLSWRHLRNSRWRKGSLTSPFYLKAGHNISWEKDALPVPGRGEHS